MTPQEREKLVVDMVKARFESGIIPPRSTYSITDAEITGMVAALAIAEAAIRKDCAEMLRLDCDRHSTSELADAILASIPEKNDA